MMIRKSSEYSGSNISVIGLTGSGKDLKYFLINDPDSKEDILKFPGKRFFVPPNGSLDDIAMNLFEKQTGLIPDMNYGLRVIMPNKTTNEKQLTYTNIFVCYVEDPMNSSEQEVFLSNFSQGYASLLGNERIRLPKKWTSRGNEMIDRLASYITPKEFPFRRNRDLYFHRISAERVENGISTEERGSALAVASLILVNRDDTYGDTKVILVQKKGDEFPGYAGGKVETPKDKSSLNLDPISCCMQEAEEELGFKVLPQSLNSVIFTPLECPNINKYYNGIMNYSFIGIPRNLRETNECLQNPREHLEEKMEKYVVETMHGFDQRMFKGEFRTPDMKIAAERFRYTTIGERINLSHFVISGIQ